MKNNQLFKLYKINGEETGLPEYSESEALSAMMHLSKCHGVITKMLPVSNKKPSFAVNIRDGFEFGIVVFQPVHRRVPDPVPERS